MGVGIDVAISSIEASLMLEQHVPDLIISDIRRGPRPEAGLGFLAGLGSKGVSTPLIFYIGDLDNSRPKPRGSFGITNVPSELFHLTFDVLERIRSVSG